MHPYFFVKFHTADHRKLFSKLCIKFSAVCVFTKKCTPYFFEKSHAADHRKLFSKLCIKLSAVCLFTKKYTPYFFVKFHTADHYRKTLALGVYGAYGAYCEQDAYWARKVRDAKGRLVRLGAYIFRYGA